MSKPHRGILQAHRLVNSDNSTEREPLPWAGHGPIGVAWLVPIAPPPPPPPPQPPSPRGGLSPPPTATATVAATVAAASLPPRRPAALPPCHPAAAAAAAVLRLRLNDRRCRRRAAAAAHAKVIQCFMETGQFDNHGLLPEGGGGFGFGTA